ncbi:MAG TPA: aminotransferase class III-fold pyridoxal phosphate-dependent enzyme [Methylomirabilota bacterium]|jgi:glutamate-1-semialdehyde 2,1-aminomutase|nr:aminotransferase class III-fold pyridoxal phosphate-dependent enzyme [Methylomirabilota bacterium]
MTTDVEALETLSRELLATAARYLPGACLGQNTLPTELAFVADHGEGARLVDVRGRTYLDFVLGSGPLLLGHAHPAIVKAVQDQVAKGSTYFWLSEPSIRLAEEVVRAVPCAEQVRFVSTGTEGTMFAGRMARTFTGREKILKFEGGWHGLHDYAMVGNWRIPSEQPYPSPPPDVGGIPRGALESVLVAPFNDLETTAQITARHADDLAAIIVEPLQRAIRPRPGFLAGLRDLARQHGALLIFDEVVTGFRLAYGGAQERYGVVPDLAVFGKALTAGFPLAAIAGRADVMATAHPARKGTLDYAGLSGTLSGNALACAAGVAALGELRRPGVYPRLHALGERLRRGIGERAARVGVPLQAIGDGPIAQVFFVAPEADLASERALRTADAKRATRFGLELLARGLFVVPNTKLYISLAHTERDIDWALGVMEEVLREMR